MKTLFYTDIKSKIFAGMQFCYKNGKTKNDKIKQVGFKIVRIYFDSINKDRVINEKIIKTVIYEN